MSFSGQSNTPWQRGTMQGHPQSGGYHQGSQMFMQNAQQSNMAAFGHGGMQGGSGSSMFPSGGAGGGGSSVSYPQPRTGLNPVAFQQGGGQSHYNSIGTVTKISNDCGLVNDEVFFYRSVCKGPEPKLGDRVIFEATYSTNSQFKWNATRVQLMQQHTQHQSLMGSGKGNYSSVAPPNEYQRGQMRHNSPKRSPIRGGIGGRHERDRRGRELEHPRRSRDREEDEQERKRRREDHDRSRDRITSVNNRGGIAIEGRGNIARNEKDRDRAESRKKDREITDREREERDREREKERARDKEIHRVPAKGRRARPIRRYMVQIPKSLLIHKSADIQDLRQRYTTLYIPSDFFHANIKWSDTFTPDNPFSLRRPCQFHIMHKLVETPYEQDMDQLEPADSNYLYSAKVMLMAVPPITEIYKKCFESDTDDYDHHTVHPARLINFLVGVRGRNEPMAIGGPWSPSLDGENPDKDPSVLIRTAIRTCKALTGIDLSNCTQWYRFMELYYHRTEYKNMEKDGPPRVETVVIYLPDVHSCMPTVEEWQKLSQDYKDLAEDIIDRRKALAAAAAADSNDDNDKTGDGEVTDEGAEENSTAKEQSSAEIIDEAEEDVDNRMDDSYVSGEGIEGDEYYGDDADAEADPDASDDVQIIDDDDDDDNAAAAAAAVAVDEAEAEAEAVDENEDPVPQPTHYSLLDLKTMKAQEIRDELLARNLPDKGVRNIIMARLAKALNTEKAEETRNRNRPKPASQKTTLPKKAQESGNKVKNGIEKMDVDHDTSKTEGKKATNENKKKPEKKSDDKINNNEEMNKTTLDKANDNKAKNDKEEQEELADIMDFELGDIVILDEYDSSKNPEENTLKEMNEKEKGQLMRRYTLPPNPQIVAHPNRHAKGGKFDCALMSLSVLLDYHPDDTKERFFEVSLFAEIFNEMLMRDFAFNIYKEIYLFEGTTNEHTDTKNEDNKKEKSEITDEDKVKNKDIKKDAKDKDDEKDKSTKKDNVNGTPSKDHNMDDTQSIKSESRKRKLSISNSIANGRDHEPSTTDKKMVVVKPQLLLSFVYFDTTHCGYIFEKDLEDLFSVLGLRLSRSQIKKVLGKLATRQAIYYRKLTDKEESLESTPSLEDVDDLPPEELKRIAAGNNLYEDIFGNHTEMNHIFAVDGEDNEEELINYNGTVIHVGKLVNQIKRTEKNYSDLEKLYNDLLKQHSDLKKDHNKSTAKIKDLQSEMKSVQRKLTDANQDLYSLNRKYRDQNATLSYIYTRVAPYFVREKDKDKDAKIESSREKDKDDRDKEKEKEKDKTKESDKEKDKSKDEKDKEKTNDEKDKEKVKEDKEKEKQKNGKEKEKTKDDKEKEKEKNKR